MLSSHDYIQSVLISKDKIDKQQMVVAEIKTEENVEMSSYEQEYKVKVELFCSMFGDNRAADAVKKLISRGRSYEWIYKALYTDKIDWKTKDFGLLLGNIGGCLTFQAKVDKQIYVPKEYTEEEIVEMQKPTKVFYVDLAALESRKNEQQQKREVTGLYDLDSLFEM